jgi:hypothetical protein
VDPKKAKDLADKRTKEWTALQSPVKKPIQYDRMTLAKRRDMFAAAALTGLLSNAHNGTLGPTGPSEYPVVALKYADALMKELDK